MEQITPSLTASFRGARRDPTHAPSSWLLPTQFPFLPHTHAPPRPLLSPAQHMLAPNATSQRLHLRSREDLHAPLPATRRGRQGFGLTYPAGPRWKVHRPATAAVFRSSARWEPFLDVPGRRFRCRYGGILQGVVTVTRTRSAGQSLLPHSYAPSSSIDVRGPYVHLCFDSDHRNAGCSRGASNVHVRTMHKGVRGTARPISNSTPSPAKGTTFPPGLMCSFHHWSRYQSFVLYVYGKHLFQTCKVTAAVDLKKSMWPISNPFLLSIFSSMWWIDLTFLMQERWCCDCWWRLAACCHRGSPKPRGGGSSSS
jgi:hypothetical protein